MRSASKESMATSVRSSCFTFFYNGRAEIRVVRHERVGGRKDAMSSAVIRGTESLKTETMEMKNIFLNVMRPPQSGIRPNIGKRVWRHHIVKIL